MARHASARATLIAFATALFFAAAGTLLLGAGADAQLDYFAQVAPELAQPDRVKTSAADAADAAAAKAAALAALDRSLPACAEARPNKEGDDKGASSCALVRPLANNTADDPAWSQFEAAYAGTVWLPAAPAAAKTHIKAAGSYLQISKLPLSRSVCAPGSAVAARLVLRLPAANGTKYTAGLLPRVNELADSATVRRCVLAGVTGLATPQEAAAAAAAASAVASSAGGCTECNALSPSPSSSSSSSSSGGYGDDGNKSDEQVKLCPSTPGVWYVDTLPLRVPTAAAGWCDDDEAAAAGKEGGGEKSAASRRPRERLAENDAFAAFVVNAGSSVDVAFFDIVPRAAAAAGSGAQSA